PPILLSPTLPHPGSTLFPYTALFRSGDVQDQLPAEGDIEDLAAAADAKNGEVAFDRPLHQGNFKFIASRLDIHAAELHQLLPRTDRKRTRLNSSHRTISYAVFCLKKK